MYYGSVGSTNLCLRGNTATNINPTTALGAYNGMWIACAEWPETNNFSLCKWSREADNPKVNTDQGNSGNYSFDEEYKNGDRLSEVGVLGTNSGTCKYGTKSPFALMTSGGSTVPGYSNNTMSNVQNYVTTDAVAAYGYTFFGWRLNSTSGTALTLTTEVNWFFNSTYGGTNFAYIKYFAATFGIF